MCTIEHVNCLNEHKVFEKPGVFSLKSAFYNGIIGTKSKILCHGFC